MTLLIIVIVLALLFDFINGFHDAANAVATLISSRVLTPFQAVLWSACFNFLAYFVITEHAVANTVAKMVTPDFITLPVLIAALLAAISWNLLTWWKAIPSSSSHTLIGGFLGAGVTHAYFEQAPLFSAVNLHAALIVMAYIVLAPCVGLSVAYITAKLLATSSRNVQPHTLKRSFKIGQLISSAALSFAHGGNDAQKVMGIIFTALVAAHTIAPDSAMPHWVPLACYTMIALGTMVGGWRIIKTLALRITRLSPLQGFSANIAGAITLFATAKLGIPVSTTHTMTGSVIGVGLTQGVKAVRWPLIHSMALAWVVTIPVSGVLAAVVYSVLRLING